MERSRILICVRTVAQKPLSLPAASVCAFVHGRKFRVRSGKAHRRIRNGGTVVWLSRRAFGQVQMEDVRIMDRLHRTALPRNQNDTPGRVNRSFGHYLSLSECILQTYHLI